LVFQERVNHWTPKAEAPIYALVSWFTKLPAQRDHKMGMFKVLRDLDMRGVGEKAFEAIPTTPIRRIGK
jgi:hypothetical protein